MRIGKTRSPPRIFFQAQPVRSAEVSKRGYKITTCFIAFFSHFTFSSGFLYTSMSYRFLNAWLPYPEEVEAKRLWEEVLFPAWSRNDMWHRAEYLVAGYSLPEDTDMVNLVYSLNRVVGWPRDGPVSAALVSEGLHVYWDGLK